MEKAIICLLQNTTENDPILRNITESFGNNVHIEHYSDCDKAQKSIDTLLKKGNSISALITEKHFLAIKGGECIREISNLCRSMQIITLSQHLNTERFFENSVTSHNILRKDANTKLISTIKKSVSSSDLEIELREKDRLLSEMNEQIEHLTALAYNKNRLYSVIAHDLRTSIGNLANFSHILHSDLEALSQEEIKRFVSILKDTADNTNTLLSDLLHWTKSSDKNLFFQPQRFYLLPIVEKQISLLKPVADKKKILIAKSITEDVMVYGDPNMLGTIINNLISNAIIHNDSECEIMITANMERDYTSIVISDDGKGMHVRQVQYLREMFENNETFTESASGLGLIVCREFAAINNATIELDSMIREGTIFNLTFMAIDPNLKPST